MARMYKNPMGIGAIAMSMTPQREYHDVPKGITAKVINAGMNDSAGASTKSGLYAAPG